MTPALQHSLRILLHDAVRQHRRYLAALRRLMRATGHAPTKAPGTFQLSPAEQRVLARVVVNDDKLSAIWSELHMSKSTFETHLNSLYAELKVRRRSGLVRVALQQGLV